MTEGNEVLDEILSRDLSQDTSSQATTETTQSRDEQGRFAGKQETAPQTETQTPQAQVETPATPPATTTETPQGFEPQQALHATRQENRTLSDENADLKRQLAELTGKVDVLSRQSAPAPKPQQEAAKPKDFWENPNEFAQSAVQEAVTPLQQSIRQIIFDNSVERATRDFGAEKVQAAETALRAAIASGDREAMDLAAQLPQSRHPVGDVARWHQRQTTMQRVGNDPDAWFKAELEKLLADPAKQGEILQRIQSGAQQNASRSAPVTALPSVGNLPGSGASNGNEPDMSDGARFARATASLGRSR